MSDFQLFIDSIKSDCDGEIENKFKIEFLEMKDKDSWRPLHHACCYGRVGLVKLLLSNHCEINSVANRRYQPIHLACMNGHIDIVKILIANKCDINASNYFGYQPIHLACMNGHIDTVKILIANKCDINASDKFNGYEPIHLACLKGHIDIVKILIAHKCNMIASTNNGYQPIHLSCQNGYIDIVKILIVNKCNINVTTNRAYQPIHLACENGYIDIVKLLIANKCDINASDENGFQPIHLACENGKIDIVKMLISNIDCDMNKLSKIELIAKSMNLHYEIGCDHMFCRQSLEDEKFKRGEFIGSGTFGKVYKYTISKTNRKIVIKRLKSNCEDRKNIEGNINKYSFWILHKNIIRYFGALEKYGKLCIYMEYMPGGSLKDLIEKSKWIENSKVIKFSKQILDGLQIIHSQGIIHRDIKPENMLLDHDETLKLTDYGLIKSSRIISILETTEKTVTFCGTPNYLAPEVFLGEPYDFPADIWSVGASIIHMITGNCPYHSLPLEDVKFKIETTKKIEFTACQQITEIMQSFINDLLTPEQFNRSSAEILLHHSIFDQ